MSIGSYTVRPGAKVGENDGLSVPWSRPRRKRTGVSARLISALTILALLAAWTVSAELQLVSPVFLPSPAAVWAKFVVVARDGFVDATLLQHVTASLWRVFAALIVAIVVSVPVGLAIGISRIGRGV
ncbi:MAG: taurine ABC transporter permease, partial [Mesorhizobium sp.]